MNYEDLLVGQAHPAGLPFQPTQAPTTPQATIHDQFMMAAITGLLAQGMQLKDAVHESRRVADAAMQTRKQKTNGGWP